MKNLILNNKHKEMLLEMSHKLFPKDYFSFENDSEDDGIMDRNFNFDNPYEFNTDEYNNLENFYKGNLREKLNWNDDGSHFHWYEWVHTQLVEKILNPTPEIPCRNIANKFKDFFWESNCYWSEFNKETASDDDETIVHLHPIEYLYKIFKQTN